MLPSLKGSAVGSAGGVGRLRSACIEQRAISAWFSSKEVSVCRILPEDGVDRSEGLDAMEAR